MNEIKELNAKIGKLASALEIMNANATTETALTVKVANEVFGKTLANMQEELTHLEKTHARDLRIAQMDVQVRAMTWQKREQNL
jgi:cation transport regulator ChaC